MELREHYNRNSGLYGWLGLAAYVIAFDILAPQTLSTYADRLLENPRTRIIPWAVGGIVAGHVLNLIPERIDPIARTANYVYDRWIA